MTDMTIKNSVAAVMRPVGLLSRLILLLSWFRFSLPLALLSEDAH